MHCFREYPTEMKVQEKMLLLILIFLVKLSTGETGDYCLKVSWDGAPGIRHFRYELP